MHIELHNSHTHCMGRKFALPKEAVLHTAAGLWHSITPTRCYTRVNNKSDTNTADNPTRYEKRRHRQQHLLLLLCAEHAMPRHSAAQVAYAQQMVRSPKLSARAPSPSQAVPCLYLFVTSRTGRPARPPLHTQCSKKGSNECGQEACRQLNLAACSRRLLPVQPTPRANTHLVGAFVHLYSGEIVHRQHAVVQPDPFHP